VFNESGRRGSSCGQRESDRIDLYSVAGDVDRGHPAAGLVSAGDGTFYGTTEL
jgi:hypothetical protein